MIPKNENINNNNNNKKQQHKKLKGDLWSGDIRYIHDIKGERTSLLFSHLQSWLSGVILVTN